MRLSFTPISLYILFLFISLASNHAMAQINGGFEIWSPSGSPPPFDWRFPAGWTTTNATSEFIGAGVSRNTDSHSGTYAAQLRTLNIFGTITRSQLAIGTCKLDFPHYQLLGYTGGDDLPMVPGQVSFYYKLTTGDASEYAVADILIKRPTGNEFPDTLFYQSVALQGADAYTEVNIDIPEVGINTATDSIVVVFSSNDTNEVALNILYVDDLTIDFVSANDPDPDRHPAFTLYPNPLQSGEPLTINVAGKELHNLKMIDSLGRRIKCSFSKNGDGNLTSVALDYLVPGVYGVIMDDRYVSHFVVIDQ